MCDIGSYILFDQISIDQEPGFCWMPCIKNTLNSLSSSLTPPCCSCNTTERSTRTFKEVILFRILNSPMQRGLILPCLPCHDWSRRLFLNDRCARHQIAGSAVATCAGSDASYLSISSGPMQSRADALRESEMYDSMPVMITRQVVCKLLLL